ncbi:aminotransferase class V-fold PLP-dependent enzyme [Thermoproteota archaeon]
MKSSLNIKDNSENKGVLDVRKEFPILETKINDKPLIYLDNAATTQKPICVIDRLYKFYTTEYATISRGVYTLSQNATIAFDKTRETVGCFINAKTPDEIIFVRGATEGLNLIAYSWAKNNVKKGQSVLITEMEHHANILPWQRLCQENNADLRICPVLENGALDMDAFEKLVDATTALAAITHVSNVLGTINPVKKLTEIAHQKGAVVVIDGAQSCAHMPVDVQDIDCDFFVFSGHKVYGPTGVGVVYGKKKLLDQMEPYQLGGGMIKEVDFSHTTFADVPVKFEAGTPAVAEAIGLGQALTYVQTIGMKEIAVHEKELLDYCVPKLQLIPEIQLIGTAPSKSGVISFTMDAYHPHDVGTILDEEGIAVRVGHHCAQPLMRKYNVSSTIRISFGIYNTKHDIDKVISALKRVKKVLK